MKNLLKTDLSIKIISVVLAILFWIIVFNTENPFLTKKVTVPITVINEKTLAERGIELISEIPSSVDAYIRGRGDSTNQVTGNDFEILLDLSVIESVDDTRIKIPTPKSEIKDVYVERLEKDYLNLQMERIISKTFPIDVKVVGIPKDDYKVLEYRADPGSYTLKGLESLINDVSRLETVVDVSGISGSLDVERVCNAYDDSGEIIQTFSGMNVKINVEIGKEVPVIPFVIGAPEEGYVLASKIVSPSKLLVKGPSSLLAELKELVTEQVNIDGMTENTAIEVAVNLPEGFELLDMQNIVSVNVAFEKMTEGEWIIDSNNIVLQNRNTVQNYNYSIVNESVKVKIRGKSSDIAKLTASSFKLYADVENYGEGFHGVPLKVVVSGDYTLVSADSVQVKIEKLKTISINNASIELRNRFNEYNYNIVTQNVDLLLLGYSENLEPVTNSTIKPYIDVGGLGTGLHSMEVNYTLPSSKVRALQKITVLLDISRIGETAPTEPGNQ
ncbi:MAG: CdaR family protein [Eubacteriales bacterium]|nr:CdaR family protein [Eubacteriales bacterium]